MSSQIAGSKVPPKRRRNRNDGGLYQRHDHWSCPPIADDGERPEHTCRGRWVANIEVVVDGKRRRKSIYRRTQKEAQAELRKALREKDAGTLVIASMTVGKWLDYWLDNIAAREVRPQTMRSYRSKVDTYLIPLLGRHRLTALRPEHVRDLHDTLRARGLSEATVRQTHAILRASLRVAMYEGKVAANVADLVKAPKTQTEKRLALTVDQARIVLREAGDDARWWLAIFYGMRQGEVLGLRRCDIDLDAGVLVVNQSLQTDTDGTLIFGPPKSRASRRPIPLVPQIEARLRLALHDAPEDPEALVFSNAGKPIQPKSDWRAWRELLATTNAPLPRVPVIPLHAARNSSASLMEAAGIPERLAMQILGHSQVTMTRAYTTADIGRMRDALTGMGNLLALE